MIISILQGNKVMHDYSYFNDNLIEKRFHQIIKTIISTDRDIASYVLIIINFEFLI